jgi:flagellar basal-body rod protein FlgC
MTDLLIAPLRAAASGLFVQSERMLVAAQNIANARTTGSAPGADPYRRKTISFRSQLDRQSGVEVAAIARHGEDKSPFKVEYNPGHPAADRNGFVKMPNVNMLIETADLRDANRMYQANLQVVRQAREIITMTIDLLRTSG